MQIEKLSDTEVKIVFTSEDLEERKIQLDTLTYGSAKMVELLSNILPLVDTECNIDLSGIPIMIEAIPMKNNGLMMTLTVISNMDHINEKIDILGEKPTHRTFKNPEEDRETDVVLMDSMDEEDGDETEEISIKETIVMFNKLSDVEEAALRIITMDIEESILYKYNDRYWMVFRYDFSLDKFKESVFVSMLDEIGEIYKNNDLGAVFLQEHGKVIIKENAVGILSKICM